MQSNETTVPVTQLINHLPVDLLRGWRGSVTEAVQCSCDDRWREAAAWAQHIECVAAHALNHHDNGSAT